MKISQLLTQRFGFAPTSSQLLFFDIFEDFCQTKTNARCFLLKGYAGTGKTTCLKTIVQTLPLLAMKYVLLAPTGRAAKVITQYTEQKAFTIHKRIYRKKSSVDPYAGFVLAPNMAQNTLFIVDEASMITDEALEYGRNSLLEDLIRYVYQGKNCQLMLVGDAAQLPPVGSVNSLALDRKHLEAKFDLTVFHAELQEVIRQGQKSGILYNATQIRKQIVGERHEYPAFQLESFKDIFRMTGHRLIEGLEYAYRKYGEENTIIVCRSNKSANLFNQQIRHRVLYREEEITGGDLVMVVKNNYFWLGTDEGFIANGDIALVERVLRTEEKYGKRFADVRLCFVDDDTHQSVDCKVLMDSIMSDNAQLPFEQLAVMYDLIRADYEQEVESKNELVEKLKADPYYNAIQIKFAYAVTCHKAQGGQWGAVFVDQGYLTDELLNVDFLRWLYTAITRSSSELFLVNFSPKFFLSEDNDLENW